MRSKKERHANETDRELVEHLVALGLPSVDAYRVWCREHGFGVRLHKHWKQRCRERRFADDAVVQLRLAQKKREKRSHAEVLEGICKGNYRAEDVTQRHLKRLCDRLGGDQDRLNTACIDRTALTHLLTHLDRCRTKLFRDSPAIVSLGAAPGNTYVEAVASIACYSDSWLRPIGSWKPRTHNTRRQFGSLVRHLFCRHDDMPEFFDSVWFASPGKSADEHRQWYIHVGSGQSIRHARLPLRYTKKMAHHFMRAPAHASVSQALRWGQVLGLGGDESLARALMGTRLAAGFRHNDFWAGVIRWFIDHPMLDRVHVGPIVDYVQHQRFAVDAFGEANERVREAKPAQPNLTMKGRTPNTLLRQVAHWHRSLSIEKGYSEQHWYSSGIAAFVFEEGSVKSKSFKVWTIRELLSQAELVAEGRRLKHCVASYAASCARGHCSIWTAEVESSEGSAKVLTIEVRNQSRTISQVRGKANRLPTEKELSVIRRWAAKSGLSLGNYF